MYRRFTANRKQVDPTTANKLFAEAGLDGDLWADKGTRATKFFRRYSGESTGTGYSVSKMDACNECAFHHPNPVKVRQVFGYAA